MARISLLNKNYKQVTINRIQNVFHVYCSAASGIRLQNGIVLGKPAHSRRISGRRFSPSEKYGEKRRPEIHLLFAG